MEQREENVKEQTAVQENTAAKTVTADVFAICHDVLKNLWVAVLVGISAAFLTYVGAFLMYQPQYVSQTTFVVSARGSNTGAYANLSQTQRLAEVFRTVLDSDVLKKLVAEELGKDSFEGSVNVSIVPETNLLTVSVTADSPTTAFQQLNTMLEQYPAVSRNVLGQVVLEVFEDPNYPSVPSVAFQGNMMMKRGFLAGAGVMIVLFALFSYFKDTVKNEKEVEAKLDTSLYATIYHEWKYKNLKSILKREKKKIWLTEPSVSFGFGENIKKIRTKILYHQKKSKAKVLLVSSAGSQEGKTTLAVNLAIAFAQYPRKVLLIEGNLRTGGLREYLGIGRDKTEDWGVCAESKGNLKDTVHFCKDLGFYVMVNDTRTSHPIEAIASASFTRFLDNMKEEMDLIIIDAPQVRGRADTEMWIRRADMSLLVVKQNKTLAKYINDSIDVLEGYGNKLLGCVFNDVPGRSGILRSGYGYGYGYGKYGKYGKYGHYGHYGRYGSYASHHRHHHKKDSEKKD